MFLTQKSFWKILTMAICYFVIGSIAFAVAIVFSMQQLSPTLLYVTGGILYALCPLIVVWGKYAEGKGKYINQGNKLVRNELKPSEFVKLYEELSKRSDLVINKPSIELLQLLLTAYDALGDKEHCIATADKMIAVADRKKRPYAMLIKSSVLFSYGMTEEAEAIFVQAQSRKLNFLCQATVDTILKCDRAIAMGDYKTAEIHHLNLLSQSFPKPDNLGKLIIHHTLGEIYEKLNDREKAILYYQYSADHGGETAMTESAKKALERLK